MYDEEFGEWVRVTELTGEALLVYIYEYLNNIEDFKRICTVEWKYTLVIGYQDYLLAGAVKFLKS